MKNTFFRYRFIFFPLLAIAFITVFSFIVMQLWNNVLAEVVNVQHVSFWQAMGLLVLSKILFGGLGMGKSGGGGGWRKHKMEEKMKHMSPEEREKFKAEMQNRCGSWGKDNSETRD
ncbi:MAG: hypothetical protein ACXWDO_02915 [Bacteroidia bacterium]